MDNYISANFLVPYKYYFIYRFGSIFKTCLQSLGMLLATYSLKKEWCLFFVLEFIYVLP